MAGSFLVSFRGAYLSVLPMLADKRFLSLVCLVWQAFFEVLSRRFFERSFVALLYSPKFYLSILSCAWFSFASLAFNSPFIFGASGGQGGQGGLRVPPMPSLDSPITPL